MRISTPFFSLDCRSDPIHKMYHAKYILKRTKKNLSLTLYWINKNARNTSKVPCHFARKENDLIKEFL